MELSEGIILIDKPSGMTSHDVIAILRKKLSAKGRPASGWKIGHAGTLDPLATGLLIVLVGREYTKRQAEFMAGEKEYICRAKLGIETDTYDIEGKVIREEVWEEIEKIKEEKIKKLLKKFTGKIQQRVPAFSAVKVKGKKLYEKARKGQIKESELPVRLVEIKELELANFSTSPLASSQDSDSSSSPKGEGLSKEIFFEVRVVCSKGTYIRSLIYDIGQELGVGATVVNLRRTRSGKFRVEEANKLDSEKLFSHLVSDI